MPNKMLIDATHPEETRVVVVRGNRVEEFDYESASRKQLRGNIYLAKVTRVEPSLQAAFIEYGGNRHGFLAFSEIHPDYYQIPVADRLALIEEEERAARAADEEDERRERRRERPKSRRPSSDESVSSNVEEIDESDVVETIEDGQISGGSASDDDDEAPAERRVDYAETDTGEEIPVDPRDLPASTDVADIIAHEAGASHERDSELPAPQEQAGLNARAAFEDEARAEAPLADREDSPILPPEDGASAAEGTGEASDGESAERDTGGREPRERGSRGRRGSEKSRRSAEDDEDEDGEEEDEGVEQMGSDDAMEEVPERSHQRRARSYKIQEVIRRRQVMLVQVVKEERGNKGAALTTYLSLAGRYSVLMPNTARGGGISRKITNAVDRKRLKEVVQDLEVPEGMGIILRTAGANRTKVEIKRDFEYLLRLWETVRELTLTSSAPSLVYEEGSLIKRAIRDLFNKDIDDIHVAGDEGFREARDFMRMLMPSHVKNVVAYNDHQPIFAKHGVEHQLDAMFSPVVQLKSGGYIVINPTEALVSIDVNSGRSTREHHIEDTALKTNLEASEEIARQLRLRDLAGLIVIDFIDMEEKRNNRAVERKLKDCLKNDRARIQVGRISHFGLMEMSRQRIRTGVLESSIEVCPTCGGTGHVRSAASVALQLLRAFEEQLVRGATHNLIARTRSEVALYVLNQKRAHLRELEERFSVTLLITADESVTGHQPFLIEKGDLAVPPPAAPRLSKAVHPDSILPEEDYEEEDEDTGEEAEVGESESEAEADGEGGAERVDENGNRRRRRRRRRRGERDGEPRTLPAEGEGEAAEGDDLAAAADGESEGEESDDEDRAEGEARGETEGERRRRRRGRRGGRRNRREGEEGAPRSGEDEDGAEGPLAEGALAESEGEGEADGAETTLSAEVPVALTEAAFEAEPVRAPADIEGPAAHAVDEAPTTQAAPVSETAPRAEAAPVAPAPSHEPVSQAVAETAAEPEPEPAPAPRRRSTVREKAPVIVTEDGTLAPADSAPASDSAPAAESAASNQESASVPIADADIVAAEPGASAEAEAPLAQPAPVEASESQEAAPAAKPRSGWWQRKLFGGS
ncbi:Rne/Rng family ribonuclease [Roseixanthobacter glucoisosaccharinicivorans]|uniref:Rne/Rng family ribonuclease n=1 Tax=Roseixanthobacter glucoisosaccharinicivorans TaxID=3119923 RepID=UPI00372CD6F4